MSTTCATRLPPAAVSAGFDETAGLDPRRWHALPIILIGSFLAFLDFFIVNIALPAMRADLGASPAQLQFIVAAYGISFGISLITGGRLGDIYVRKRVFLIGISGFTITSALCGLSPTAETLITCRVAQAICAAIVTPQVLAIIRVEFAASERPIAIGLYGASMCSFIGISPAVGGEIDEAAGDGDIGQVRNPQLVGALGNDVLR